jgi:hypothetical protein
MTVSDLLQQPCYKLVDFIIRLIANLLEEQACNKSHYQLQACDNLLLACSKLVDNLGQAVPTQLVDRFATRSACHTHQVNLNVMFIYIFNRFEDL